MNLHSFRDSVPVEKSMPFCTRMCMKIRPNIFKIMHFRPKYGGGNADIFAHLRKMFYLFFCKTINNIHFTPMKI